MLNISGLRLPMIGDKLVGGKVYFVDSGHAKANDGNLGVHPDNSPLATIDGAIGMCTAANGDFIVVMPGHSETAATQITCDVAGVSIIGVGYGQNIPAVTAHASAADCVNVTADDVYIENIRLIGAASCTAFINVAAADFTAKKVWFDGVATPENQVTIAAGGTRFNFLECRFESQTNGPNYGILIEAPDLDGWVVKDCIFNFHGTGLDDAGIGCSFHSPGGLVDGNVFIGMDATAVDFNSSSQANIEGIISNNLIGAGATMANIDTLIDPGGYACINNMGTDIPTERGGYVPVTSPV